MFISRLCVSCRRSISTITEHYPTIFALASGKGSSGVAVIRISGSQTQNIVEKIAVPAYLPSARNAVLRSFVDPDTREKLDKGLLLLFPGPKSYTGEDVAELHVHGGPAVINAIFNALGKFNRTRLAEPGEFTKRAFLNGKLDLTEAEGVADLIKAQTSAQRRQALRQVEGLLSQRYADWRQRLLKALAYLEAYIDFGEEEAIEPDTLDQVSNIVQSVQRELENHLKDHRKGERLRNGVHVTILGQPNVGKSSLLNSLCQRPVAIVSPIAGTTRDIVESAIDIGDYPVLLSDTAGLRSTDDEIESEGVSRAIKRATQSDLIIVVVDAAELVNRYSDLSTIPSTEAILDEELRRHGVQLQEEQQCLLVLNKMDLLNTDCLKRLETSNTALLLSCRTGSNMDKFLQVLTSKLENLCGNPLVGEASITQERHRQHLTASKKRMEAFWNFFGCQDITMAAHELHQALRELGKITGRISGEEILDVIFKDFCIGK